MKASYLPILLVMPSNVDLSLRHVWPHKIKFTLKISNPRFVSLYPSFVCSYQYILFFHLPPCLHQCLSLSYIIGKSNLLLILVMLKKIPAVCTRRWHNRRSCHGHEITCRGVCEKTPGGCCKIVVTGQGSICSKDWTKIMQKP